MIDWTGERFLPEVDGQIKLEHIHRYQMVMDASKGKRVLDIASGEGYGSALLAEVAKSVTGVDISDETVSHAQGRYKQDNLQFTTGSCSSIPLEDNSIDIIISFETIEHHDQHAKMLEEFLRVLTPDGVVIISSPDKYEYSDVPKYSNAYHVKELYSDEFKGLMGEYFKNISLHGQRVLYGSLIIPEDSTDSTSRFKFISESEPEREEFRPIYNIIVASNSSDNLPLLSSGILEGSVHHADVGSDIKEFQDKLDATKGELDSALNQVEALNRQLTAFLSSASWRLTKPLRLVRSKLKVIKFKVIYKSRDALKYIYYRFPLPYYTKHRIKNWVLKKLSVFSRSSVSDQQRRMVSNGVFSFSKHDFITDIDLEESFSVPVSDDPVVTIVIPVYGKVEYTYRCLNSISKHCFTNKFEVIVVDDCSPDETLETLKKIDGIRVIANEQNMGFIRSCNRGAEIAKGEYLLFLNNDTEVTNGWFDELLYTFKEFPGAGLVGSKLVYPTGKLQEAGGIIWRDGSAWNFGRGQDPQLPVFNYAREVDYISGASIMMPKILFEELEGFDEHYLPAYCEDSDMALRIRDKGYRVIYQPLSTVIHHEGITSGTDEKQGVKAYQVENTRKLYSRWKDKLQNHQRPGIDVDNEKDRRATLRALVIDHCTPLPNQDAGSITLFNTILLLREMGFQVTFIAEDNFLYLPDYTTALQRAGIEVLYMPFYTSIEQHLIESGSRYDLALLFRPGVVNKCLKTIRKYCPKAKVLFHTVDLHYLRMMRESELQLDKGKQKAANDMKQREFEAIRACDASIVHSTVELKILQSEIADASLHVFPLIMDVRGIGGAAYKSRKDIVFVGGYQHTPNIDAVQYFVTEVMPLLRTKLPGVCFYAVGSKVPAEIRALESDDVVVTGFVEELVPFLDKMRLSVAPLRYGAGIKGKVGMSMSVGLPVVSTSIAAEGMSLTEGENILIADDAEAFANTIVRIYQDEVLWKRISEEGVVFAENAWGAEAAWKILADILHELGIEAVRDDYPLSLYSESRYNINDCATKKNGLVPIASVTSHEGLNKVFQSDAIKQLTELENKYIATSAVESFTVDGLCVPCNKKVAFLVDMESGGERLDNGWRPNWRERLACPLCRMNNRQRLIATLVKQELDVHHKKRVYFMEQVTSIFDWATATFNKHDIVGSEYLGYEYEGGTVINGIRHEDVENLSFSDNALDLIVSNDVFEHVPNPGAAFVECARVLKPGGLMIATMPFHSNNDESVVRATLIGGQLEHILTPAYHGNPVSTDGSLVFTDFGWDVLDEMKNSGFSDVSVEVYASAELGHLGGGQLVLKACKSMNTLGGNNNDVSG